MLGRICCTGTPEDYAAVHALQDQCSATPLSSYGNPYTPRLGHVDPSVHTSKTVREQVNDADAVSYFNRVAPLMKDNPPTSDDARIVKRMARLGIVPGRPFDINGLDPAVAQVLPEVPRAALAKIMARLKARVPAGDVASTNGWTTPLKTGVYSTDYRSEERRVGKECRSRWS